MDLRWVVVKILCRGLQRLGRGRGKFVFAMAARPDPINNRLEVVLADTTAVPTGLEVRKLADQIVQAHSMWAVKKSLRDLPEEIRDAMQALEERENLGPGRTWRTTEEA